MTETPGPSSPDSPRPDSPRPEPSPSAEPWASPPAPPPSGATGWKVATAVAVIAGLLLSGTIYLLMDRQIRELREELDDARAEESDSGGSLADLLGGLLGGDAEDLDFDDLLGSLLGEDGAGEFDPILFECLAPSSAFGLNLGGGSIPDGDIETQVDAVVDIVAEERGLPANGDFDIEFVSMDEVQRRAVDLNSEYLDRDEAAVTARLLAALGAADPEIDLVQAQLDALEAGVGGFYNTDTAELVIGSESMDAMGAFITAHELVHAMADAELGLPDLEEVGDTRGADAAYAALSAIEGDASLYSQRFVGDHLSFDQLLELESASEDSAEAMAALPYFIVRSLEFPYLEGMTFTCDVFLDGGWEAVDETYRTIPTTSAQILFPDRYRAGEDAIEVREPAGPEGWDLLDTDTFGAADLLFLLEAPGDDEAAALDDPQALVEAWAGGAYTIWADGDDSAVAVILADRGGAPELCETIVDFYTAAFPDADRDGSTFTGADQSAVVECEGNEVALGIGPDVAIATAAISP